MDNNHYGIDNDDVNNDLDDNNADSNKPNTVVNVDVGTVLFDCNIESRNENCRRAYSNSSDGICDKGDVYGQRDYANHDDIVNHHYCMYD